MAKIILKKVNKSFGATQVIPGIDLTIEDGEFVVFVGPSGCGKSTLLRLIAGLEDTSRGTIEIDGKDVTGAAPAKRGLAMVFQSYALYPHMSVKKTLAFGLETAGAPKAEIEAKVAEAARILKIEPLLERKPKALSGGQRQRVAIGRAIVRNPRLFLFDEPLSNLDAELRVQMRVEIAKLHRDLGTSMVYVTHDQVEAMTLADKIVVLHGGIIEQVGSPLDLYNRPANIFVAGFIGSPKMNFLKGAVRPGKALTLDIAGTDVPLALPTPAGLAEATLGVRPEHVEIGGEAGVALGDANIDFVEQLGGQTIAYGRLSDGQAITVVCEGQKRIANGETVTLRANPALLHVFGADTKRIAG